MVTPTPTHTHAQVWDTLTGRMKKDLSYQAEEMFMMHDEAVLALGFSRDSELLVSGGRSPPPPFLLGNVDR